MVELPYEIWHYICSFLTLQDLILSRSLNRAFRQLEMERRFQCLHVNFKDLYDSRHYRERLSEIGSQEIATRIQSLIISSRLPFNDMGRWGAKPIELCWIEQIWNFILPSALKSSWSWRRSVAHFDRVTSISIASAGWEGDGYTKYLLRIAEDCVWHCYVRLTSLSVALQPEYLISNRLSSWPTLPVLETFELRILSGSLTQTFHISTTVPQFINRNSSVLRSLTIRSTNPKRYPLGPLISTLQLVHPLSSLDLTIYSISGSNSLWKFIGTHSGTLTNLTLHFPDFYASSLIEEPFTTEGFVPLPLLEVLNVEGKIGKFTRPTASFIRLINKYSAHLKHLAFSTFSAVFELEDWSIFTLGDWYRLTFLKLSLGFLASEVFEVLGTQFPSLFELDMCVQGAGTVAEGAFSKTMKTRKYPASSLRHITLTGLRFASDSMDLVTIVEAFPALLTVNDVSRNHFLSSSLLS